MWYQSLFFFCKQKTAYEMRISDWSSDVCSSDLHASPNHRLFNPAALARAGDRRAALRDRCVERHEAPDRCRTRHHQRPGPDQYQGGRLFTARSRAADHLSDRDRDRGHPQPQLYTLDLALRSEEHTSELQSLMRNSYAVVCLKK